MGLKTPSQECNITCLYSSTSPSPGTKSNAHQEGSWDEVMRLIGQAHTLVHQNGVLRVQTDIRAGTRTDKKQHFSEKVSKVESILAGDAAVSAGASAGVAKKVTLLPLGGNAIDAEGNQGHLAGTGTSSAPAPVPAPAPAPAGVHASKGTWASMLKK
jgi:hypothetical protein